MLAVMSISASVLTSKAEFTACNGLVNGHINQQWSCQSMPGQAIKSKGSKSRVHNNYMLTGHNG